MLNSMDQRKIMPFFEVSSGNKLTVRAPKSGFSGGAAFLAAFLRGCFVPTLSLLAEPIPSPPSH
jgi:hypothetical protein